ncbi:MAG TPA: AAA family ATPase [Firmicutes bacterium]|nr:AAA family ATPase [Bacillota bacterium]
MTREEELKKLSEFEKEAFMSVLPPHIRRELEKLKRWENLIEVVLDLGRRPEARFSDSFQYLSDQPVSREDIEYVRSRVGEFDRDNRAGIERTLHRISCIRNRRGAIVGLTLRVGRAIYGTIDIVRDLFETGKSVLLLGCPGVGKTTLLREAARVLSDKLKKRVVVVDTSNEIGGDGDIPHPAIGSARRMQVPFGRTQADVMIEAVENHMPEVIIIDEIGRKDEAEACRTIAERGVQLIATAHGNTLDNLLINPVLSDLLGGITTVILGDEEAQRRGTQKTVLERSSPPSFDILVEIRDRDTLAVYYDVAEVVDKYLRGYPLNPEIRKRKEGGKIEIKSEREVEKLPKYKPLKIFTYGVSRDYLEQGLRSVGLDWEFVNDLDEAEALIISKTQERRNPGLVREAQKRGIEVLRVKSNTKKQIKKLCVDLRNTFLDRKRDYIKEIEEGVREVLATGKPYPLYPAPAEIRKIQHKIIREFGLRSESQGEEPFRCVIIFPK